MAEKHSDDRQSGGKRIEKGIKMGFIKNQREEIARQEIEKAIASVPEPDGRIHVLLIRSFGQTFSSQVFGADQKYNEQINEVLNGLQDKGLEIIRVETNSVPNQGIGGADRYDTLITYR